jgi:hypothetical protein
LTDSLVHASEFEALIARLFKQMGASIVEETQTGRDPGYDLRIRASEGGAEALVEIKLYRTLKIANNIIRQSLRQLEQMMRRRNVARGILVTNARVAEPVRTEGREIGIAIYDFDRIARLVDFLPELASEWERLSQEGFIYRSEPLPPPRDVDRSEFAEFLNVPDLPPPPPPPENSARGTDICQRLKASKPGKGKPAVIFEALCLEALKYLFDEDFINWTPQKRSHTHLHRFDLIARISSQSDFWTSMIADHRARYIIFEFKNYGKPITPTEIYTSERYLLPTAMRSTAIIISRKGVSDSAYRAMAGALRESAKLVLNLDIEQVCAMLHMKDNGDDPSTVIADQLDALLVGMER